MRYPAEEWDKSAALQNGRHHDQQSCHVVGLESGPMQFDCTCCTENVSLMGGKWGGELEERVLCPCLAAAVGPAGHHQLGYAEMFEVHKYRYKTHPVPGTVRVTK